VELIRLTQKTVNHGAARAAHAGDVEHIYTLGITNTFGITHCCSRVLFNY
jgi:hypothetical protein